MPSWRAACCAFARSREAMAVISHRSPRCIAGITFWTAILATPRTPQRSFGMWNRLSGLVNPQAGTPILQSQYDCPDRDAGVSGYRRGHGCADVHRCADVHQGCRTDLLSPLHRVSPSERHRAHVAAGLQVRAAVGEGYPRGRADAQDAALVCRTALRRLLERRAPG